MYIFLSLIFVWVFAFILSAKVFTPPETYVDYVGWLFVIINGPAIWLLITMVVFYDYVVERIEK